MRQRNRFAWLCLAGSFLLAPWPRSYSVMVDHIAEVGTAFRVINLQYSL